MNRERREITIAGEELDVLVDTVGGDGDVVSLTDGNAAFAEFTIAGRSPYRAIISEEVDLRELFEHCEGQSFLAIITAALKHFLSDDVADEHLARKKEFVKSLQTTVGRSVEVIDPNAGINERH